MIGFGTRLMVATWVLIGLVAAGPAADAPAPLADVSAADTATPDDDRSTPVAVAAPTTSPVADSEREPVPTTAAPRRATLAFTGDILVHSRVWRTAAAHAAEGRDYDFRPMFEPIRPWIEGADWSICHMEVNLDAESENLTSFPRFRAPAEVAFDLADLGYDSCSTASNHSIDLGVDGTFETLDVLESAGLAATGTARSEEEHLSAGRFEVNGIRVAHLSYTYWFNGLLLPDDTPWAANEIDETAILAAADRARAAGADVVILSLHWGEQYQNAPNAQQLDLGPRLLASPNVDAIIGHHAHVPQRIDRIDEEWLVYGLGDLISNYGQASRRDELLVTLELTERADGRIVVGDLAVLPIHIDRRTLTVWPAGPGIRPPNIDPGLAADLDAAWQRMTELLRTGSGWDQLTVVGG